MFSLTCVKNSVHGGGGLYPSMHWAGGCISQYTLGVGVAEPPGRHPTGRQPSGQILPQAYTPLGRHPTPDGHCSGRYASYWNAFLFSLQRAKHTAVEFGTKGKSYKHSRTIRKYEEFDPSTFTDKAFEIYVRAHECLQE